MHGASCIILSPLDQSNSLCDCLSSTSNIFYIQHLYAPRYRCSLNLYAGSPALNSPLFPQNCQLKIGLSKCSGRIIASLSQGDSRRTEPHRGQCGRLQGPEPGSEMPFGGKRGHQQPIRSHWWQKGPTFMWRHVSL